MKINKTKINQIIFTCLNLILVFFCETRYFNRKFAGIVQLVEHLLAKEDVARSSRVTRYFQKT